MEWMQRYGAGLALWGLFAGAAAGAENGVSNTQVLLGQSAPLSGATGELGELFRAGAQAYFDKVNAQGGIHGRKIRLLSLDDQYDPAKTLANTEQLLQRDKVFALFGYIGTPTVEAVLPMIVQERVPLFAPTSGAGVLREPFNPLVFNIRASYVRETEYLLRQLQGNGQRNIAVLYQKDQFGIAMLNILRPRMERHRLKLVGAVATERNGDGAEGAAENILAMNPDVVILISTYPVAADMIKRMRRAGYRGGFSNYSFVGSQSLAARLPDSSVGIVFTQVVPFPWKPRLPIVHEYQKVINLTNSGQYSFVGLEGFIAARALSEGLRRAGRALTREGLIQALETINPSNYDGGGFDLRFEPDNHNGSDFVDLSAIGTGSRFIN